MVNFASLDSDMDNDEQGENSGRIVQDRGRTNPPGQNPKVAWFAVTHYNHPYLRYARGFQECHSNFGGAGFCAASIARASDQK